MPQRDHATYKSCNGLVRAGSGHRGGRVGHTSSMDRNDMRRGMSRGVEGRRQSEDSTKAGVVEE